MDRLVRDPARRRSATSLIRRLRTLDVRSYFTVMRAILPLPALMVWLSAAAFAEPLETPVAGPMQVCFKYSSFALAGDERITTFDGSAEGMAVTVQGPNGAYLCHSKTWPLAFRPRRDASVSLEGARERVRNPRGHELLQRRGAHGNSVGRGRAERNGAGCSDIPALQGR